MAHAQTHYRRGDPWEPSCRTCKHWSGDRSWPINETKTGQCRRTFPPFFVTVMEACKVEPETKATDICSFIENYTRPSGGTHSALQESRETP